MKMTPQPPSEDGKEVIPRALNNLRKKISIATKDNVERSDVVMDGLAAVPLGDGDDDDNVVADDSER